jgi:hypothetical protein
LAAAKERLQVVQAAALFGPTKTGWGWNSTRG